MTQSDLYPPTEWRAQLASLAVRGAVHGELDPSDGLLEALASCEVGELVRIKHLVSELRSAVGLIARHVDGLIARDVARHGPIRLGDSLYAPSYMTGRKLLPGMGEALFDYLGPDLRKCVNPSDVKITGLRTIAEVRGDDRQAIEDTFYEKVLTTQPELAVVPVSQRKWAERLKDGERGHA